MTSLEINKKKPSAELISLIKDLGSSLGNLRNLIENIKQKAREENFSDFEITLLARRILNISLTKRQLNYWLPTRTKPKKIENTSSQNEPGVHIDNKKGTVQSPVPTVPQLNGSVLPSSAKTDVVAKTAGAELDINQPKSKTARVISFSDLVDRAKSIDSTIYASNQQLKEDLENQSLAPPPAKCDLSCSNFFQVSKDCDFIKEHFKAQIEPKQAIEYLQKYVGRCRMIDFAFRVVE